MVYWLPFKRVIIQTPLTVEQAVLTLSNFVVPRRFRWLLRDTGKYEGSVTKQGFDINRVIGYQNSFLPILHGKFCPTEQGTRTEVWIAPHPIVLLFMVIWCGATGLGSLSMLIAEITSAKLTGGFTCLGGFFLFGYSMLVFAFSYEANKAVAFINEVFSKATPG